jgi:hypothetical protein
MKTYFIIVGVAVVLIALLGGVAVHQNSQLDSEKAHNAELQNKVASLEQEVTALKETADYYFQSGVDQQSAGHLQEAKTAFEAVVAKFPASNLVGSAQERLRAVNEAIAKAEAYRAAEMQRQREEQEKLEAEMGVQTDFATFSAKARAGGLEVGKRYRFEGTPEGDLAAVCRAGAPGTTGRLESVADFDDPTQKEAVLRQLVVKFDSTCTIVASMGYNGTIHIHRAENCH